MDRCVLAGAGGDCCKQSCNSSTGSCSSFWCLDPEYANATTTNPGDDKQPPSINPPANYATNGGALLITIQVNVQDESSVLNSGVT
jgi:hypothetical protein